MFRIKGTFEFDNGGTMVEIDISGQYDSEKKLIHEITRKVWNAFSADVKKSMTRKAAVADVLQICERTIHARVL